MLLSEDDRRKRGRQFVVGIQMTVISWCLEFVAGVIVMTSAVSVITGAEGGQGKLLPDLFFSFIVIPASYLLNNEIKGR